MSNVTVTKAIILTPVVLVAAQPHCPAAVQEDATSLLTVAVSSKGRYFGNRLPSIRDNHSPTTFFCFPKHLLFSTPG